MYEGVDTIVLYEELAYEDVLPARWTSLPEPFDPVLLASSSERNLKLLQAMAALEEHGPPEKPDEHAPHHADIVRLDMKINLLLDLVGQILVANQQRPPTLALRFNARGAVWRADPPLASGAQGSLEIYLRECIVQPLRLFGQITQVGVDGKVKAKFIHPGDAVADLIEKLAFRRHRRQVAGARHPKRQ